MAAALVHENTTPLQHLKAKRRAAEHLGRQAESVVADFLQRQGYKLLAQRFKSGAGEIDLIVANKQRLIFVEVKARSNFSEASYALLPRQQARLLKAANAALACHPEWSRPEIRFDVALVAQSDIQMIENALWLS